MRSCRCSTHRISEYQFRGGITHYQAVVDELFKRHKMTTRAIRDQLGALTDHIQLMLSHLEHLKSEDKAQTAHIVEAREVMRHALISITKIQKLAAIEIEDQK